MKCRDCKFWTPPENNRYGGTIWKELGTCGAVLQLWDYTQNIEPDYEDSFTEDGAKQLAFVNDGSRYHAELLCRPDFGCVEFVQRGNGCGSDAEEPCWTKTI